MIVLNLIAEYLDVELCHRSLLFWLDRVRARKRLGVSWLKIRLPFCEHYSSFDIAIDFQLYKAWAKC